jgi:hypothetical protein
MDVPSIDPVRVRRLSAYQLFRCRRPADISHLSTRTLVQIFSVALGGIWETIKRLNNPKVVDAHMNGFQELLFVCIGIAALPIGWKILRPSYRVWLGLNWLLFVSTSFVLSVPRYTLTLFPIFIIMGAIAKQRWSLRLAFACWSLLFLALFTTFYVRGQWAF